MLCGPALDFHGRQSLAQVLADREMRVEHKPFNEEAAPFTLFQCRDGNVAAGVYQPGEYCRGPASLAQCNQFLAILVRTLARYRPNVVLTYGGNRIAVESMRLAKQFGATVVFALHNFAYHDPRLFDGVDAVIVPSRYCAEVYRERLGLDCTPLPSPLDWSRICCERELDRQYVTFVNPALNKGALVFYAIADELHRRRPDIALLMVEGRGGFGWMAAAGVDLRRLPNLHHMATTLDPRDFYRVSRMVLMPSLWDESFGRVAAEAQINGIPVLASDRGALPEVVGNGGFLLPIPERYGPETLTAPTADEVAPWIEAIIRLWDDDAYYVEACERSKRAAKRWQPERVAGKYEAFFRGLLDRATHRRTAEA